MEVKIRKFEKQDIENKVKWINDERNNQYLHYDLPLEYGKTLEWFLKVADKTERYDAVIECNGIAVGLIGLLGIDEKNSKAEYYISIGEHAYKGKGVATVASEQLLNYAFYSLKLNKIYLYTESENQKAQKLFERIGFDKEGLLKNDLFSKGRFVDRYVYGITRKKFERSVLKKIKPLSQIQYVVEDVNHNQIYMKREDAIPISFGGNKARKALNFFEEIDKGNYDCVVTYGSSSSNHCRVVSNMSAGRKIPCYIISPEEASKPTFNSRMMELFGAEITVVPVKDVHKTIESKLEELRKAGKKPYFIAGGGHGNLGTQAYIDCYKEIKAYEQETGNYFEYIIFASGTGTTQAGLVCGQLIYDEPRKIVGISIARQNPRGRRIVLDSVKEYLKERKLDCTIEKIEEATVFLDDYTEMGYGKDNSDIQAEIREVLINYGIPLDSTYTAKAYVGMKKYIKKNVIKGKNILFIHTGGTPLFFDDIK